MTQNTHQPKDWRKRFYMIAEHEFNPDRNDFNCPAAIDGGECTCQIKEIEHFISQLLTEQLDEVEKQMRRSVLPTPLHGDYANDTLNQRLTEVLQTLRKNYATEVRDN